MNPFLCEAVVEEQTETQPGFFRMICRVPAAFPDPVPGQFVHLRLAERSEPLLPRPYGIVGFRRDGQAACFEIYYGVIGPASRLLSVMPPGRAIPCLGPLGRGFHVDPNREAVLVAGGRGVAPLLMVYVAERQRRSKLPFVYGMRTHELDFGVDRIALEDRFLATDDGTLGLKGTAYDALLSLPDGLLKNATIYACGPEMLLKRTALYALSLGIPCQVSLEATLACGVGICRGCAIPAAGRDGYLMCCSDGPVVDAREVRWEAMR